MAYTSRALSPETWPDFAALVEKHKGIWGGCWCMGFHPEGVGKGKTAAQNRQEKEARVREGRAHAALVYDGDVAVGWCQFGPTEELPRIKHKRAYEKEAYIPPDWRITCFFVDKDHRQRGVAAVALQGALDEIARLGGGVVESYPEDVTDRTTSSSFLYNATARLFEQAGFEKVRRLNSYHWVMARTVPAGQDEA